jgi:long-chain acyl-CoA synthetase
VIAEAISKNSGGRSEAELSGLGKILAKLGSKVHARSDLGLGADLVMDSLSRVELASAIEDQYHIDLDEVLFTESTTIGELEQLIRKSGDSADTGSTFSFPRWPLKFPISWIRPMFYELVIYPITLMLCWVKVRGIENLTNVEGPLLFSSNHVTYIDPALIISAMPRRIRRKLAIAMDGERLRGYLYPPKGTNLWHRVRGFFTYWLVITFFNAFPLPKASGFRKSFEFAGQAMDRGYNILIFPEGELTKDGDIQPFKSGVGILANGLEAPIMPVAITGLYELRNAGQRGWAPPGRVTITFGEPITYDPNASAASIASKLEESVRVLAE